MASKFAREPIKPLGAAMMGKCPFRLPRSGADKEKPYDVFSKLREEVPILQVTLPFGEEAWMITRYRDIVTLLADPRFGRNPPDLQAPFDVNAIRDFVVRGISTALLEKVRKQLRSHAMVLIRDVENSEFDIVQDYCMPLAALAFCEVFGTPSICRSEFLQNSWSLTPLFKERSTGISPENAQSWFKSHFIHLLVRSEASNDPNIFSVYRARVPEVSTDNLVERAFAMLVAGNDSAANLLSSAVLNLSNAPTVLDALSKDERRLTSVVKELTRFDSPVFPGISRYAQQDLVLFDKYVTRGNLLLLPIAAAGRDPDVYFEPNVVRLAHSDTRNLAFGYGEHFCPGFSLAQLIVEIGISTIFETHTAEFRKLVLEARWSEQPLRALLQLKQVRSFS